MPHIANIQSGAARARPAMPRKSGSRLSSASAWAAFLCAYLVVACLVMFPFRHAPKTTVGDGRHISLTVTGGDGKAQF